MEQHAIIALLVINANRDREILLDWASEKMPYNSTESMANLPEEQEYHFAFWRTVAAASWRCPVLVELTSIVQMYSLRVAHRLGIVTADLTLAWLDPDDENGEVSTCTLDQHSKLVGASRPPNIFDEYLEVLL